MKTVRLGKTELTVNKNGFGALPIQRIPKTETTKLLRKAFDNGIDYFDTARYYTDSEEKIGAALADIRSQIVISTKTGAQNADSFWKDLETSLRNLRTDYIDIYQFHNPAFVPKPDDGTGLYEAALQAKEQGKIRHIGITNHRLAVAREAVASGLYATMQFPLSYLSTDAELALAEACRQADMGVIAMKALSGGLINDAATAYAFLAQYDYIEPIWGIQRESELDDFLACQQNEPALTPERLQRIQADRTELAGDFCRGCGYCMPCPAGIEINNLARMSLMLRRAPHSVYLTQNYYDKEQKVLACLHCNQCRSKCPYGLDTPTLLRRNYDDFMDFWQHRNQAK
ncbi:MAG: aldo/keto reductase [Victivallales bacterium]|nr:aldo/keto reductase [Victivallales bacterium]